MMHVLTNEEKATRRASIVVSVGTDHHRFDRLVRWMDDFVSSSHGDDVDIVLQRGTSKESRRFDSRELIPHAELCELFAEATVVVCHGGPSTVMDARRAGHRPIVVPRDPAFDEHVDGHQMRFARHLDAQGMATVAFDEHSLFAAVEAALDNPESVRIPPIPAGIPDGVVQFGKTVDAILGIHTPLVDSAQSAPAQPARRPAS